MSRVAKLPITIPQGVQISKQAGLLSVKGPKGKGDVSLPESVEIVEEANSVSFKARDGYHGGWAQAGTVRALLNNIIFGVTKGFERKLELVGVGYRAQAQGKALNLTLGYSHPVVFPVPEGVTVETPSQTEILVKGADRQLVGQVAAKIRSYRPPEPYKGKGVKYADEVIMRKEAKKK
jgi:large subunit ribosomal protein L6